MLTLLSFVCMLLFTVVARWSFRPKQGSRPELTAVTWFPLSHKVTGELFWFAWSDQRIQGRRRRKSSIGTANIRSVILAGRLRATRLRALWRSSHERPKEGPRDGRTEI